MAWPIDRDQIIEDIRNILQDTSDEIPQQDVGDAVLINEVDRAIRDIQVELGFQMGDKTDINVPLVEGALFYQVNDSVNTSDYMTHISEVRLAPKDGVVRQTVGLLSGQSIDKPLRKLNHHQAMNRLGGGTFLDSVTLASQPSYWWLESFFMAADPSTDAYRAKLGVGPAVNADAVTNFILVVRGLSIITSWDAAGDNMPLPPGSDTAIAYLVSGRIKSAWLNDFRAGQVDFGIYKAALDRVRIATAHMIDYGPDNTKNVVVSP